MMIFSTWEPPADVFFSGNHWLIKVELAGISPDEIEIRTRDNILSVRGSRRDLHMQEGFACHTLEISYCNFERNIALASPIDPGSIDWDYRAGILHIRLRTIGNS